MKYRILILAIAMFVSLVFVSNGWAPGPTSYKKPPPVAGP